MLGWRHQASFRGRRDIQIGCSGGSQRGEETDDDGRDYKVSCAGFLCMGCMDVAGKYERGTSKCRLDR